MGKYQEILPTLMIFVSSLSGVHPAYDYYKYYNYNSLDYDGNHYDQWHTPAVQEPTRKHTTLNNIRTRLLDFIPPGVSPAEFFSLAGTTATAALLGTGYIKLTAKVKDAKQRISANTDSIRDTCTRLNEITAISNPVSIGGMQAPTPSPSAVSASLGTRELETYPIIFPLGSAAGAITVIAGVTDGLAFPTAATVPLGVTNADTALSLVDFNNFRINVLQAIDILDAKMREMLAVQAANCP